jgi:hypothetical protein
VPLARESCSLFLTDNGCQRCAHQDSMPRVVTDEVDSTLAQLRVVIIHPLILVIIPHCKLQHTSTYMQGMPETVVQYMYTRVSPSPYSYPVGWGGMHGGVLTEDISPLASRASSPVCRRNELITCSFVGPPGWRDVLW